MKNARYMAIYSFWKPEKGKTSSPNNVFLSSFSFDMMVPPSINTLASEAHSFERERLYEYFAKLSLNFERDRTCASNVEDTKTAVEN